MRNIPMLLVISFLFGACTLTSKQHADTSPLSNAGEQANQQGVTPMTEPTNLPEATPTASSSAAKGTETQATQAVIKTTKGAITVKLNPVSAPKTVANFISKAKSGYYNNLTFHRVEDWVIQGGDPEGTGRGGGDMPTELSQVPFKAGSLGVARGPNIQVSNDSQFFICTTDCNWLTGQYTNFGEVTSGMDVAKAMAVGDTIVGVELL